MGNVTACHELLWGTSHKHKVNSHSRDGEMHFTFGRNYVLVTIIYIPWMCKIYLPALKTPKSLLQSKHLAQNPMSRICTYTEFNTHPCTMKLASLRISHEDFSPIGYQPLRCHYLTLSLHHFFPFVTVFLQLLGFVCLSLLAHLMSW